MPLYLISWYKNRKTPDGNKLDWGLWPRPAVGASLLWEAGAIGESEEWGEGAVVWCSLPAREHDFLVKEFRPARVRGVPWVARASPLAASLGGGVERSQGGELGQLALVEFISILCEGKRGRERRRSGRENMLLVSVEGSQRAGGGVTWRRRSILSQLAHCRLKRWIISIECSTDTFN